MAATNFPLKLGTRKISWKSKQTVIPEAAVNALELEDGDYVTFLLDKGKVYVEKEKP